MSCYAQSSQSPRGALVGLSPPNKAPSHHELKYETLLINGIFVKIAAPLHKRKASPIEDFLATVLHSIPRLWPGTYRGVRQVNWPC